MVDVYKRQVVCCACGITAQTRRLALGAVSYTHLFDNLFAVASTTECTGLIPAAPEEAPEITSYSDIYDIPLANDPSAAVALRTKCKKFAHKTQKGEESDSSGILAFFAYYYEMLRSRLV